MVRYFRALFLLAFALVITACSAQEKISPELHRRIEQQVRNQYSVPPDVNVALGTPAASEVPGFDKLPITISKDERSTTLEFLLAKDGSKMVRWSPIDLSTDLMSKIDTTGRPVRGSKDAKVTIVNFDDFQCPYCAMMYQTLFPDILKTYGDRVKIVFKDYPLTNLHPWAMRAAVDSNCLAAQNPDAYWEFADYAHLNQRDLNSHEKGTDPFQKLDAKASELGHKHSLDDAKLQACLKDQSQATVRASMAEGDKLGIDSTPTMYINGEKLSGAEPPEVVRDAIDRALRDAGQPVPAPPAQSATKAPAK